jgi:hypothetical protein
LPHVPALARPKAECPPFPFAPRSHGVLAGSRARAAFKLLQKIKEAPWYGLRQNVIIDAAQMHAYLIGNVGL